MKDTRMMKRILMILLPLAMVFSLAACGGGNSGGDDGGAAQSESVPSESATSETAQSEPAPSETAQSEPAQSEPAQSESAPSEPAQSESVPSEPAQAETAGGEPQTREDEDKDASSASSGEPGSGGTDSAAGGNSDGTASASRTLIAFFSRAGENHGVGVIEEGNTHIIADMIAEETGADLFEIKTVNPYPDTYDECTAVAKQEQKENARPELAGLPENLDEYDTVFIGYPIWWGDLPMAVYTFLESCDFSGKTVVPFCTHEGSGLAGTESSITEICSGAAVLDGLAIRGSVAQNKREEAKAEVSEWLKGLSY